MGGHNYSTVLSGRCHHQIGKIEQRTLGSHFWVRRLHVGRCWDPCLNLRKIEQMVEIFIESWVVTIAILALPLVVGDGQGWGIWLWVCVTGEVLFLPTIRLSGAIVILRVRVGLLVRGRKPKPPKHNRTLAEARFQPDSGPQAIGA